MTTSIGEVEAGMASGQSLPDASQSQIACNISLFNREQSQDSPHDLEIHKEHIEDYPQGYPRYAALKAGDGSLHIYRRFSRLRSRLLLAKQDHLTRLESELDRIDRDEKVILSLGSLRGNNNEDRQRVLSEIDDALTAYDAHLERLHRTLLYRAAEQRQILSLQNWTNNNASLARKETTYLTRVDDLLCVAPLQDSSAHNVETWVEQKLIGFCRVFKKCFRRDVSSDPSIYMFSSSAIQTISRFVVALLTLMFLVAPAIICNVISRGPARLTVVGFSVLLFVVLLAAIVRARAVEILVAGTTYATLLIVFISGNDTVTG